MPLRLVLSAPIIYQPSFNLIFEFTLAIVPAPAVAVIVPFHNKLAFSNPSLASYIPTSTVPPPEKYSKQKFGFIIYLLIYIG